MATYACTDLHGQKDLLVQIQKFLKPDDVVFFLGDAADRGSHGWEMIKMIAQDKRFIPIKGNHEDMLIDAARSYYPDERIGHGFSLLASNGGRVTFYDMTNDQWGEQWINHIRKYPTHAEYTNTQGQLVLLSHAGYTPIADPEDGGMWLPDDSELIWSRDHFWDDWDEENFSNAVVVHGHTPMPYMADYLQMPSTTPMDKPIWYANRHKVCIDTAAFATGFCFLLNLDTWEHLTFNLASNND